MVASHLHLEHCNGPPLCDVRRVPCIKRLRADLCNGKTLGLLRRPRATVKSPPRQDKARLPGKAEIRFLRRKLLAQLSNKYASWLRYARSTSCHHDCMSSNSIHKLATHLSTAWSGGLGVGPLQTSKGVFWKTVHATKLTMCLQAKILPTQAKTLPVHAWL